MLSNEEKEAIEWLKRLVKINKRDNLDNTFAEILLNLIEKQSKEIEELKDKNKKLKDKAKELIFEKQELSTALLDSTPNDKIKVEIEELKNMKVDGEVFTTSVNYAIKILQSLLEKE